MKLYLEGHNVRRGYAVGVTYCDEEILSLPASTEPEMPVRFYENRRRAEAVIARFNRRFGT
ncbi:hypothetical protein [Pseudomonas aeruginosa]|uniref:hypothetical protein n=1 Tax=Pseudomonas aeruginosa TaxID=287 RepID=UPI0034E09C19